MIDEHTDKAINTWQRTPHVPPLETDAVHVWRVRFGDVPTGIDWLSPEERHRAERLAEPARTRFLTARNALRSRLAAYLDRDPASFDFSYGDTGKPALRPPCGLHFSIAHSADVALLAFARSVPVGIDLERLRPVPRRARIAPRVMAAASARALAALPEQQRDDAFIWAWTQREAYVKAIGGGVLRSADPLPFVWPPRGYESEGWTVAPLAADAHHHACLAVAGTGHVLHLFEVPRSAERR